MCLITKGKSEMLRNYKKDNQKLYAKKVPYQFPKGNTRILITNIFWLILYSFFSFYQRISF